MIKRIILIAFIVVIIGGVLFFAIDGAAKKENGIKTVPVERGSIVDKALAVGRIEPQKEISVKSKISGIVKKTYADIGDKVKVGDPLFDIAPDPTPVEFAEAKRQVQLYQVTYDNALALARYLDADPMVSWVSHPGLPDHPSHRRTD